MKKICYVVTVPLSIRSFFLPQLKYLAENGFDVSVICSEDGRIGAELGSGIHYIPVEMPRGVSFVSSAKAIRQLRKIFQREQFDLIQYSTPNAAFYASVAAKLAGCKIRNYHLMGLRYLGASGVGRFILKSIEKTACRFSTSVECVSKSNMELGIKEGLFSREKVTVVWNGSTGGVDIKRFDFRKREMWRSELRTCFGYAESDVVFGFVGRVTRDKGINELIAAFDRLNRKSKLFIIGNVEDAETIDKDLWERAANSPDVIIHEASGEIQKFLAMMDVLVLPSYREGFGNVVIEAGAVGTPAIVSNIPGPIDAMIPGKTGLLAEVKDVTSLQNAMETMLTMDYKAMGTNAKDYVIRSFRDEELNRYILKRKMDLLSITM